MNTVVHEIANPSTTTFLVVALARKKVQSLAYTPQAANTTAF